MPDAPRHSSILFLFCAPAASGKSTVCHLLLERDSHLKRSVSTTTRPPREGEVDGNDYNFVSVEEFNRRVKDGLFTEYAEFGGYLYGTEKKNIENAESGGFDLLLDLDVQGVEQVKKLYPEKVVTIFIFPPSFAVLEERLRSRGTDSVERQEQRLALAFKELEKLRSEGFADYLLINDQLEDSITEAQAIISAERQKFSRQTSEFMQDLFERS